MRRQPTATRATTPPRSRSWTTAANGCLRRSRDGGRTWGGEVRIWELAGYGCANHTFPRLGDGRLLKSVEEMLVWGSYPQMTSRSGCFSSDDGGHTWQAPAGLVALQLRGTMENHIAETAQETGLADVRARVGATLETLSNEFFFKAITGDIDAAAEWDAYVAEWRKAGGDQIIA